MIRVTLDRKDERCSFDIDTHVRVAILGENGIGKTSILASIAAHTSPLEWLSVQVPEHLRIAYFSQIAEKTDPISGGEHTKKRLMELFTTVADLYVLDEPTNNLDQENIEWLKHEIMSKKLPILFTSHDIDFIDELAEMIFFLDSKGVEKTKEKCSRYLESRKQKITHAFAEYEIALRRKQELLESSRSAKQYAEEGAKWKSNDNDKFLWAFKRDKAAKSGGLGRRLEARAERIDVERPKYDPLARVILASEKRKGHLFTLNTTALNKSRVSLSIKSGDKVLITGKNGVGKTTLLEHLVELLNGAKQAEGEQFSRSGNFSFIYLTQDWYEHLSKETVSEYMMRFGLETQEQYQSIAYNYLDPHILEKKFQDLSPGVRVKVLLGILSFKKYDLIIWDEPTNHLDVMIQKILKEAFVKYEGGLLLVSHDRFLGRMEGIERLEL